MEVKYRAFIFRLFLLSICILITGGARSEARLITGGVDHEEYLSPAPEGMQVGHVFASPAAERRIEWFPVPDWLAGSWLKDGDLETYMKDFRSGEESSKQFWINNKVRLDFGHQYDSLGTVWHAEILPFRADGQKERGTDQRFVMEMSCLKSTPAQVMLKFKSVVATIEPGSRRVADSRQQEEIVFFEPSTPGNISTRSSTKTFSDRGQPLLQYETHTNRRRISEFAPKDNLEGMDLRASLASFLESQNMRDRIPR